MKNKILHIFVWVRSNWFQLTVLILMSLQLNVLFLILSILSDTKKEISDVSDGIEVQIVDYVDSPFKLPKLPRL